MRRSGLVGVQELGGEMMVERREDERASERHGDARWAWSSEDTRWILQALEEGGAYHLDIGLTVVVDDNYAELRSLTISLILESLSICVPLGILGYLARVKCWCNSNNKTWHIGLLYVSPPHQKNE